MFFLSTQDEFLDAGYSVVLKQDAWRAGGDVEADAVSYLMGEDIQLELCGIFEAVTGSSLDVERKHQQDKRSETTKVSGIARASRDSIIRRYLVAREGLLQHLRQATRKLSSAQHLNVRALAIHRHPELMPRGRGQLR